ncbi:MAG: winged helix-turn-helix domain-containing protein, partial [Deltaproteobacteria bacterium]|nr:winged helix-turn-helix domain-containing protein [Deltaproteobacteria bacterium]
MTFTEAAAQVLRIVGKPLHYKEITDVAIERDLLSHVGKSPDVTMGARLTALVKKADRDSPLVRVKPGVFALREWDQATIDRGLSDRTPALKLIEAAEATQGPLLRGPGASAEGASSPHAAEAPDEDDDGDADLDEDERERAELAAGGVELFEAEEDDDEPILGADSEPAGGAARVGEPGGDDAGGRGRRRRRRRRGG